MKRSGWKRPLEGTEIRFLFLQWTQSPAPLSFSSQVLCLCTLSCLVALCLSLLCQIPAELGSHSCPQYVPGVISPVLTRGEESFPWIRCPGPPDVAWWGACCVHRVSYSVGSYSVQCPPSPQILFSPFQLFPSLSWCMELSPLSSKTLGFSLLNSRRVFVGPILLFHRTPLNSSSDIQHVNSSPFPGSHVIFPDCHEFA